LLLGTLRGTICRAIVDVVRHRLPSDFRARPGETGRRSQGVRPNPRAISADAPPFTIDKSPMAPIPPPAGRGADRFEFVINLKCGGIDRGRDPASWLLRATVIE